MSLFKWIIFLTIVSVQSDEISITNQGLVTDIAKQEKNRLLVFSTLDGYLYAINHETGDIKWKVKDKAVVQVPKNSPDAVIPLFLPDPRDGSIYLIGNGKDSFKKLPFTIPELVFSAPCRSSDGILYTGKKKDTWYMLDPKTGNRQHVLGWDVSGPTCPVHSPDAIYVGRTEYTIMMVDSKNGNRKWNITFQEYTSVTQKDALANYDMLHFTSSSTGHLITMDRIKASVMWEKNLGSPVVSAYILDPDGLISLPFTSLSNHTISNFINNEQLLSTQMKLYPTLYIGEHRDGLYALPSFVDQNMITITSNNGKPLLIEGPNGPDQPHPFIWLLLPGENYPIPNQQDPLTFQSVQEKYTAIYLGHYDLPDYSNMRLQIAGTSQVINKLLTHETKEKEIKVVEEGEKFLVGFIVKLVVGGTLFCLVFYIFAKKMDLSNLILMKIIEKHSSRGSSLGMVTKAVEELPEGLVRVGKITFNPDQLLGKGCEGTFVYRGEFDGRRVAVKRILPECFNFADREVSLLRESDAHPNVIRYFCMEQDRMFRYIALELCQATLCEYVKGEFSTEFIVPLDILKQATMGLQHLHSLNIVHRDIKPQNVLLSVAGPGGVRAMISDFGLCKKLQIGKESFSRGSGITGTDGWIAPEMLNENESTTCAVDMFSLGCLYYYVLSNGEHPFGDIIHRQSNILGGEWVMGKLKGEPWQIELCEPLLVSLISSDPQKRPSCNSVLNYPMFWNEKTSLAFLQDVSDRLEKASQEEEIMGALENLAVFVVRQDWRAHIDEPLIEDLSRYRSYKGNSLRDLLRAIRNKKHHFRDLNKSSQELLGEMPEQFISYWNTHFPLLLIHTWITMQKFLSNEETFKHYYLHNERIAYSIKYTFKMEDNQPKNVGLYRNLKDDFKVQNKTQSRVSKISPNKKKKKRNDDVPLQWVLPPDLKN